MIAEVEKSATNPEDMIVVQLPKQPITEGEEPTHIRIFNDRIELQVNKVPNGNAQRKKKQRKCYFNDYIIVNHMIHKVSRPHSNGKCCHEKEKTIILEAI